MPVVLENSFTIKELEEIDKSTKMIPLTFDLMLKNFFESNEYVLKRFLISVLHLDVEPYECNIKMINTELPITYYKEYKKTIDIYVIINDVIHVNIEMNRTSFEQVKRRNHIFHNKMVSLNLKKGDTPEILRNILNIQLNLNSEDKSINIGEDIVVPYSLRTKSIYIDNDKVYLRYLDYYRRMYYNKIVEMKEDELWLAALTSRNFYELNEILSQFLNDDLREKLVKDVIRLSSDQILLDEYERRTLDLIAEMDGKRIAKEEGISLGREEGISLGREETITSTIKSMLENNIDYETISKVTGKTIEEIKEIENSTSEVE